MSEFEKPYTLVQQTPLIHFQHDEDGATLRATEVKPKLDRFLLERVGKEGVNPPDCWFVKHDPGKGALDYKMRFEMVGKKVEKPIDDYKFYFGNMGKVNEEKIKRETAFYNEVTLTIICFHNRRDEERDDDLLGKIDACIVDFFILHNFGTRQTKGFGGFLVSKRGETTVAYNTQKIENAIGHDLPYLKFQVTGDVKKAFSQALAVYNVMKGGFNQTGYNAEKDEYGYKYNRKTKRFDILPDTEAEKQRISKRYIKGFIQRSFLSADTGDTGSDKAFIKQCVLPKKRDCQRGPNSREPSHKYQGYRYVRALLGLADHYEFHGDMRTGNVRVYQFEGVTEPKQIRTDSEKRIKQGIERFASPILIKVFQGREPDTCDVYFIYQKTYADILGKTFILIQERKIQDAPNDEERAKALRQYGKAIIVPEEFDPKDFLTVFIQYYQCRKSMFQYFDEPLQSAQYIELEGGNL